jgi:two-component system cell cycle response regulator
MVSPLHDSTDAIGVLLRLTESLSAGPSLEDALKAVTDAALGLLPADHASVRLLDPSHATLLASARSGRGSDAPQISMRSGEGIAGWVLANGRSVRIDDVRLDARFKPADGQGFAIRSILAEPLTSGGRVAGVLSASSSRVAAFTHRDELLARLLANCSVPPLERARLERLAMTDDLTLAYNARYLRPRLRIEMDRSGEGAGPSLLMMDLDSFKQVNDTRGHAVGDAVLRLFADRVRAQTRREDALVRRGGDEFAVVMPGATLDQALTVAERVLRHVAGSPFSVGEGEPLLQTVSIGVATWDARESVEGLEERADRALYRAKASGRNRVDGGG